LALFNKNSYIYEVQAKYDYFAGIPISTYAKALVRGKNILTSVGKDAQSGENILFKGLGVEGNPYCQVSISSWKISLGMGWFSPWEMWTAFRGESTKALAEVLSELKAADIFALVATYIWVIPQDKLDLRSSLRSDFLQLVRKFFPSKYEFIESFNVILLENAPNRVSFALASDPNANELKVTVAIQRTVFEPHAGFSEVVQGHFLECDAIFSKANPTLEDLLLK